MIDTNKLATDAHALAVKFGALLIRSEKLCGDGAAWDGEQLTKLAGSIRYLNGILDGLYYTAKTTLPEDDFEQFCYRCGIDRELIEDGVIRAKDEIHHLPL